MVKKDKSRRTEILEKAAILFHQKGYAATSIRDIAREMKMESASLYNHIQSKQEILQAILLPIAHRYTQGIKDISSSPLTSIQQLERIIADQVQITIQNTDAVSLVPNEWVHLENNKEHDALQEFLDLRNFYEKEFKHIFQKCIKDGYLKNVNIDIAVFSILSTLRWLYSWYSKNKNVNPLVLETELINNLIGGIRRWTADGERRTTDGGRRTADD
ncbi:MAG TPA: TetR/AcrR family transcriptional regulator [Phaeodactylibacter sp.]|nr:TetR/AcrR family transcriptional regulator [Phaeodactylibacter sp.]